MPTALPTPAGPLLGLFRAAVMLALYFVGSKLFTASMWCADFALDRRR